VADGSTTKGYIITGDVDFENVSKKAFITSARRCRPMTTNVNEKHLASSRNENGKR
jgi:hypothetical protein